MVRSQASMPPLMPTPQNAAGPDIGMVVPRTISFAVTPRSAGWLTAVAESAATATATSKSLITMFILIPSPMPFRPRVLHPSMVFPAQQPFRPDHQHQDDDRKGQRRFELEGHVS